MEHYIQFGSRKIEFTLSHQNRKSLAIKVHPDTTVEVLAPLEAPYETILKKVKTKASWIVKQTDYFASYRPVTPPRRYISGETHLYLGKQYKLKVVPHSNNNVKAYQGRIWIQAANKRPEALKEQLQQWYAQRASSIFTELFLQVLPMFTKYKIGTPVLSIRRMAKRWGSCTRAGKIIVNVDLIKAPKGCIEYVLIHELCHLVHYHHKKAFYDLLNHLLPDWSQRKQRLEHILA